MSDAGGPLGPDGAPRPMPGQPPHPQGNRPSGRHPQQPLPPGALPPQPDPRLSSSGRSTGRHLAGPHGAPPLSHSSPGGWTPQPAGPGGWTPQPGGPPLSHSSPGGWAPQVPPPAGWPGNAPPGWQPGSSQPGGWVVPAPGAQPVWVGPGGHTPQPGSWPPQRPGPSPHGPTPMPTPQPGGPQRNTPSSQIFRGAQGDPTEVGPYAIEGVIGKGGMGAVYKARHKQTGQAVALKMILAGAGATASQLERFAREVEVLQKLEHPAIVRVLDSGQWQGVPWYAMEVIDGPSLGKALPAMPLRERLRVMLEVCRAIGHAHDLGYLHRDLKPDNVLLDKGTHPRVTDFGLTKKVGGDQRLTATGATVGTPHYMSPEQVRGQNKEAGPTTDVFALGVMLYEAVAGKLPFDGQTALELFNAILERPTPRLDLAAAKGDEVGLLESLEPVIDKALEKVEAQRYPTATVLALDLQRVLEGRATEARRASAASRLLRRAQARPRVVVTAILAVLGLQGATILAVVGLKRVRAEAARTEARIARLAAMTEVRGDLERLAAGAEPAPLAAAIHSGQALFMAEVEAWRAEGASEPPSPDVEALLAMVRRAGHSSAALGLADETLAGATAARAVLPSREAWFTAAPPWPSAAFEGAPAERSLEAWLRGRAALRLGGDDLALEAELLRRDAPDDPRAPLLVALEQLARGDAAGALAGLDALATAIERAPDLQLDLALARAEALLALGRPADAAKAFAAAEVAPGPRGLALRRKGELLLARGGLEAREEAFAALMAALAEAPGDLRAARRLLGVGRALGRPFAAREALEPALRRGRDEPAKAALRALAALHAGLPGADEALAAPARAGDLAAALAQADLAAVDGEPDPYGRLLAGDPDPGGLAPVANPDASALRAARAARARWLALRGDLSGAATALGASGEERDVAPLPRDVVVDALSARAVRDAGWVHLLAGSKERAASRAAAALVALPGDLDATALLARATGDVAPLRSAMSVSGADLDGPFARGVLLCRVAELRACPPAAALAARLLRARLAGDPALYPARLFLGRALAAQGSPAASVPSDPLPWLDLLDFVTDPPTADPEDQAEARRLSTYPGVEPSQQIMPAYELTLRAVELDPYGLQAHWECAIMRNRVETGSIHAPLQYARYARLAPAYAPRVVHRLRHMWTVIAGGDPRRDVREALAHAPREPLSGLVSVLERYLGLAYPRERMFTKARAVDVRLDLDRLLQRDARLVGFLCVRGHLLELEGLSGACDRDLDELDLVARPQLDAFRKTDQSWHLSFHRAAVYAARRPREAQAALDAIPLDLELEYQDRDDIKNNWLPKEPLLDPLRQQTAFQAWVRAFKPR